MRRALLIVTLLAHPAFAEDPAKGPHAEGDYGGVQPGQPKKPEPPKGKSKRPPPKGTLSWIGFEMKDGAGQLFLQSPGAFEIAQHVDNGVLVMNLSGVNRLGANTWRPIDTRYFETSVSRISAKRVGAGKGHKAGIELRVAFKNAKDAHEASVRTATEPDGYYYAYASISGTGPTPAEPVKPEPPKQAPEPEQ